MPGEDTLFTYQFSPYACLPQGLCPTRGQGPCLTCSQSSIRRAQNSYLVGGQQNL